MAAGEQDRIVKAERKLAEMHQELDAARAKLEKAEKRGRKEIEKARALAEERTAKARSRVQRRQQAVARAEARLYGLKNETVEADLPIVTPEPAPPSIEEIIRPAGQPDLSPRETQVLEALRSVAGDGGATAGAWQVASGLSNGTFFRVRQVLLDRGLVRREGDGHLGSRYVPALLQ